MNDVLGLFIVFVLFPGVILGFILLSRYLKYRETLTMIEHGITPPPPPAPPVMVPPQQMYGMPPMRPMPPMPPRPVQQQGGPGRGTLIWGLVLSGIGLALTLALWPIGFIANSASGNTVTFPLGLGPWMLAGFVPLFVGLALILGFVIMRPERGSAPSLPPAQHPQWTPAPVPASGENGLVGVRGAPLGKDEPISPPASYAPAGEIVQQEAPEALPPSTPSV
jgi:hypothetical protein